MSRNTACLLLLICGALSFYGPPAFSDYPQPVRLAQSAGQSSSSIEDLRGRAQAGDPDAQMQLGSKLIEGASSPNDTTEGEKWLLLAIFSEHKKSKVLLGKMYLDGYYFPKKQDAGRRLLEEASADNDADADLVLGMAYLWGTGLATDIKKAELYLQKAAGAGNLEAMKVLGEQLITGWVLRRDEVEGRRIIESSVKQGDVGAKAVLGRLLLEGYYLPLDRNRGLQLLGEASNLGNRDAKESLGMAYVYGTGVARDRTRGIELLREAAKGRDGTRRLGEVLVNDGASLSEKVEGLTLLEAGVAAEDSKAHISLGKFLFERESGTDRARALKLFEAAARLGNGEGLELVGSGLMWNAKSSAEWKQGEEYLQAAAKAGRGSAWATLAEGALFGKLGGNSRSKFETYAKNARAAKQEKIEVVDAQRYMWGLGVRLDTRKSLSILMRAAERKNQTAISYLISLLRDGNGWNIRRNRTKAKLVFEKFASSLPHEIRRQQSALLTAAKSASIEDFRRTAAILADSNALRSVAFNRELYRVSANATIFILQEKLKSYGLYEGPLHGKLTARTIHAMREACKRQPPTLQCERNVMSSNTVSALIATGQSDDRKEQ